MQSLDPSGHATCTTTIGTAGLQPAPHPITAGYSGDATSDPSSGSLVENVLPSAGNVAVPGGTAAITLSVGGLTNLTATPLSVPGPPVLGQVFPYRLLGFRVTLPSGVTNTTVTWTFPGTVISYWKLQSGIWHQVAGAAFNAHDVTFTLTDTGRTTPIRPWGSSTTPELPASPRPRPIQASPRLVQRSQPRQIRSPRHQCSPADVEPPPAGSLSCCPRPDESPFLSSDAD
jgi:hypothetical protein